MEPPAKTKAAKEREAWDNQEVRRDKYIETFGHSPFYAEAVGQRIEKFFKNLEGKVLLEIGSNAWIDYIYRYDARPAKIVCLNISVKELELGRKFVRENKVPYPVHFLLCDGAQLPFAEESFDGVFGGAILHHLDFHQALQEIHRVCKTGGSLLFHEPLGINPVAKIIRALTPAARTEDETPLTLKNLKHLSEQFRGNSYYSQLFSVFSVVLGRKLFSRPDNFLNRVAFTLDEALKTLLPPLRFLYREVLLTGEKKARK